MPRHDTTHESSLRKCAEWQTFLAYAFATLPADTNHVRLARDTLILLHHNILNCARRLRRNPGWDVSGTMRDDTTSLADEATANLHAFETNPRRKDVPEKLTPLFDLIEGALKGQVRLAREIDELHDNGAIAIAVTTDRATGRLIEEKFN